MKSTLSSIFILLVAFSVISLRASQPAASRPSDPVSFAPVVTRYCVGCHNDRVRSGNLALDKVRWDDVDASAAVWEKIIQKLRHEEMPPPGRPGPDKATSEAFRESLETALDRHA